MNVSLKGPTSGDPWITVEGTEEQVRRTLWKISQNARDFAANGDLYGAAYAADAEFKAKRDGAPKAPAQPPTLSGAERQGSVKPTGLNGEGVVDQAVANVQQGLGGQVVADTAWSSGPADPQPASAPRHCKHGPMTFYERTAEEAERIGKKPFAAYYCPQPREAPDRCEWVPVN